MKPEYKEGAEARKSFEDGMRKLFAFRNRKVTKKPPSSKEGRSREVMRLPRPCRLRSESVRSVTLNWA